MPKEDMGEFTDKKIYILFYSLVHKQTQLIILFFILELPKHIYGVLKRFLELKSAPRLAFHGLCLCQGARIKPHRDLS